MRKFKDAAYGVLAQVAKALASPQRVELLDLVAQRPRTVGDLADALGQPVANISHHLRRLLQDRLVTRDTDGVHALYALATGVAPLLAGLHAAATCRSATLRELKREVMGEDELSAADLPAVLARVARGEVVLLDVRPAAEYAAGHLPGARSVPLHELDAALAEMPQDANVVACCRGPLCVFAAEAVQRVRATGRRAQHLSAGVVELAAQRGPRS